MNREPEPSTKKQRRDQEIKQTAAKLFRDRGYVDVSVRELAEAAGITQPTLYRYIGSKQQLLRTIYEAAQGRDLALTRRIDERDAAPDEKIRMFLREGMMERAQHLEESEVYIHEMNKLDPDYISTQVPIRNEIDGLVRKILTEGADIGLWPHSHLSAMRMLLWSCLRNFGNWYKSDGALPPDVLGNMFADMVLNGFYHLDMRDG